MQTSLEDIKELCDEASALVKVGLPLDGLSAFSSESAGNEIRGIVQQVQEQTASGKSVAQIIDATPQGPERLLTAAVAGGLASGRLEASLEMLGDVASDMLQIRHRLTAALIYPIIIIVIASGLTWLITTQLFFRLAQATQGAFGGLSPTLRTVVTTLLDWHQQFPWWPLAVPVAVAASLVIPLFLNRSGIVGMRGPEKLLLLIPGVRSVLTSLQFYHASRVLSLLIDNNISLADALAISAACSERSGLRDAFKKAANDLNNGQLAQTRIDQLWQSGQLPPLIAVALKDSNGSEQQLKLSLTGVTSHYQRRLDAGMLVLRQYVPVGLTVILGGTTVLLYAIAVFWPIVAFYTSIVQEGDVGIL